MLPVASLLLLQQEVPPVNRKNNNIKQATQVSIKFKHGQLKETPLRL